MIEKPTLFVAETSEQGQVVYVWQYQEERGVAQPVRQAAAQLELVNRGNATFSGAPAAEIINWLKLRAISNGSTAEPR